MSLYPVNFTEYIGNDHITRDIKTQLEYCKKVSKPFPHSLMTGSAGLGKSTLAYLISRAIGSQVWSYTAPIPEGDFIKLCGEVQPGDVVVVDEVHKEKNPEQYYTVMEEFILNSEKNRIELPPFTFIGCTTDEGLLKKSLRDRFVNIYALEDYTIPELVKILNSKLKKLNNDDKHNTKMDHKAAEKIAQVSWGTARSAINILIKAKVLAITRKTHINTKIVSKALTTLGIMDNGLTKMCMNYMKHLQMFEQVAGLTTMATVMKQNPQTLRTYVEDKLLALGMICITNHGREMTRKGIDFMMGDVLR